MLSHGETGRLGAKGYRIIVADEYRSALNVREQKYIPMQAVKVLHDDAARGKDDDLVSDRSGRFVDIGGKNYHAMGSDESGVKVQSYLLSA